MQNQKPQPDFTQYQHVVAQCICGNLRKASRIITQIYDEFLQPSGLLATQFNLLGSVSVNGPMALTPLADHLGMDPTTLARNLKPLECSGLVEITKGTDRRTRVVRLTANGTKALVEAYPLWVQAQTFVIEKIGPELHQTMLGNWSELVTQVSKR